jgi:hypothetical protein
MEHRYAGIKTEIIELAREILRAEGCTRHAAMLYACSLVDELYEFARQWDAAAADERAVVEE